MITGKIIKEMIIDKQLFADGAEMCTIRYVETNCLDVEEILMNTDWMDMKITEILM